MKRGKLLIGLLVLGMLSIGGYSQWKHGDILYIFRPAIKKIETLVCHSDRDGMD